MRSVPRCWSQPSWAESVSLKRLNNGQETLAKRKGASEKTIEMEQTSEQRRQCLSALTGKICSLGWQTLRFASRSLATDSRYTLTWVPDFQQRYMHAHDSHCRSLMIAPSTRPPCSVIHSSTAAPSLPHHLPAHIRSQLIYALDSTFHARSRTDFSAQDSTARSYAVPRLGSDMSRKNETGSKVSSARDRAAHAAYTSSCAAMNGFRGGETTDISVS